MLSTFSSKFIKERQIELQNFQPCPVYDHFCREAFRAFRILTIIIYTYIAYNKYPLGGQKYIKLA